MTNYIQYDKVMMPNGRHKILYRKPKSSTLYVKHNGSMIYYSAYKRKYMVRRKAGGKGEMSLLDYYVFNEDGDDVQIAVDFDLIVESKLNTASGGKNFTLNYQVYDNDKNVLTSTYEITETKNTIEILFNIANKKMYELTKNDLYQKLVYFEEAYRTKNSPLKVFGCKNKGIYMGFVLCHDKYAKYIYVTDAHAENKLKFIIAHIEYKNSTVEQIETLISSYRGSQWQQIFDEGLHKVKFDAVANAYKEPYAASVRTSKSPRASSLKKSKVSMPNKSAMAKYQMKSLDPYLMHSIFQHAQISDDKMSNRQLAEFIHNEYV